MKKYIFSLIVLSLLLVVTVAVKAQTGTASLKGWAWSDTIGWISFNSMDAGTASNVPYSVNVDKTTGALSGYAWSSNIGWISFNSADISGCGSSAVVDLTSGAVSGWIRAYRGRDINILGNNNGGWDGCVKLTDATLYPTIGQAGYVSGTGGSLRGVALSTTTGQFSGYGWGSDVQGWINFNPSLTTKVVCTDCGGGSVPLTAYCSGPTSLAVGDTGTLYVSADGGKSPYTYEWFDGSTGNTKTVTMSGTTISGLDVTVTDDNGDTYDLSCSDISKSVVVDPIGNCYQPDNSELCANSTTTTTGTQQFLRDKEPLCESSPSSPKRCEFYCMDGYEIHGGECVWVGIDES